MYKFSVRSKDNLRGVHPDLIRIVYAALETGVMDFSVVEGVRTPQRQEELYASGKSKTMNSKHLIQETGYGHAVDLYPYPIDMNRVNKGDAAEISRFGMLAGIMLSCAKDLGVSVTWGGDWDRDGQTLDHSFFDSPHFQLEI